MSQELLDAYLDGTLPPAREAEFIAWLRADPAHVRKFVLATHLDRALINQPLLLAANQAVEKPREKTNGSGRIIKSHSRGLKIVRQRPQAWNQWFAVGGALLAALLLIIVWVNSQTPGQPISNGKPSVPEMVVKDEPLPKPENKTATTGKQPRISALSGEVTIAGVSGQRIANVEDTLAPGDQLITGTSATASIRYVDGSQFVLAAETSFNVGPQPQHLFVERGRMTADVAHQASGSPFTIATPHALLTIIGTVFTVDAENQKTNLVVKQGHVRLDSFDGQAAQEIKAGMSGTVQSEGVRNTDLVVTSFDLVDMRSLRKIAPLHDGDIIDLRSWPRGSMPNIIAKTGSQIPGSVRCALIGKNSNGIDKSQSKNINIENKPPFEVVFGDNGKANFSGQWRPQGAYILAATPFSGPKATGAAGRTTIIHFTMLGSVPE